MGQRCREAPTKQLTGSLLGPRELARLGWKNTAADGSAPSKARSSLTDSNSAGAGPHLPWLSSCHSRAAMYTENRSAVSFALDVPLACSLPERFSHAVPSRRRCSDICFMAFVWTRRFTLVPRG
jgi:hypothetical protein